MYNLEEVRALLEGYEELQVSRSKEWVSVRLMDLERTIAILPLHHKVFLFLIGMCGFTLRDAAELLDIPTATVGRRYKVALVLLAGYMNGSTWRFYA